MADNITNLNKNNPVINNLTRFNGFVPNVYRDPFVSGNAFIFITKPLLFINHIKPSAKDNKKQMAFINMTRDPIFTQYIKSEQINDMDDSIVKSLSYIEDYSESSFLPIFTNECKSFDASDVSLEMSEFIDTKQGFRQQLPSFTSTSEGSGTIGITVTEDSNMSFTKLMTLWIKYIANVTDGTFDANPDMVLNGCLDYMSSIYYFVLEPDGSTIKYWCKYTGCWPTAIPYGQFDYNKGTNEPVELSLQFQYTIKEDMNPKILEDFNIAALKMSGNLSRPEYAIQNMYASIVESPLLNRAVMEEIGAMYANSQIPEDAQNTVNIEILKSERRDPVVLLKNRSNGSLLTDTKDARFELIFDDDAYKSRFLESVMGDDANRSYYMNFDGMTSLAKNGNTEETWDVSQFWDD